MLYIPQNVKDTKIKMVVFDKDGTLGDCTPALHKWCEQMTEHIVKDYNDNKKGNLFIAEHEMILKQTIRNFHSAIGWDNINKCLLPSAPLAACTWEEIIDLTCNVIVESGAFVNPIDKVNHWHENLGDIHSNDKPLIQNLKGYMKTLKENGLLIAICTSDDRKATNDCIRNWELENMIDFSICGDEVIEAKPSAYPLISLCQQAKVSPEECVVIGDTSADTGMGKNGNAALVVGVLTGSGTKEQLLETGAHIVVPNISFLKYLIAPGGNKANDNNSYDFMDNFMLSRVKA